MTAVGPSSVRYNKAGVRALENVKEVVESFRLPLIKARKFYGILNAIEMRIEDHGYTDDVVRALDVSLLALAEQHASQAQRAQLEGVLTEFERKLARKQRG